MSGVAPRYGSSDQAGTQEATTRRQLQARDIEERGVAAPGALTARTVIGRSSA